MNIKSTIVLVLLVFHCASLGRVVAAQDREATATQAEYQEYLMPVRPGEPNKVPFWNQSAHQFMYVPSFDFNEIEGASKYRFTLEASDGQVYSFDADNPYATLKSIWLDIPSGPVTLKVEALDSEDLVLQMVGERSFHRAAMYNGPYHHQPLSYQESAKWGLRTLFSRDYFKEWMKPGVAPEDYRKNVDHELYWGCPYPAKIMGAIVAGSALYANINPRPDDVNDVLAIGRKAADYLISLELPEGTPMEFFPPTYDEAHATGFMARNNVMMNFPSVTAEAYLDYFEATKEKKYFDASIRIADTYRKLQLPEGTWPQVMDNNTGKGTFPTLLNPVDVIRFADRLVTQYNRYEYASMRDKAFEYLMGSTMKSFDWKSQFEDGAPNPPYGSLSPAQACEFANYLFDHSEENPTYIDMALELLRFAEDQFVSWENPRETTLGGLLPELDSRNWITPCVSEQHQYWMPVNLSSSHLIESFLKAYQLTGKDIFLAKAKDLANTLLVVQEKHQGEYSTYLIPPSADGKFEVIQNVWINCAVYTIRAIMRLSEEHVSDQIRPKKTLSLDVPSKNSVASGLLDTRIDIQKGDRVTISATGEWATGGGDRACTSDGMPREQVAGVLKSMGVKDINEENTAYGKYHYGALVGRIGPEGELFLVGSNFTSKELPSGRLFLGSNDSNFEDNFGSIKVFIEIYQ